MTTDLEEDVVALGHGSPAEAILRRLACGWTPNGPRPRQLLVRSKLLSLPSTPKRSTSTREARAVIELRDDVLDEITQLYFERQRTLAAPRSPRQPPQARVPQTPRLITMRSICAIGLLAEDLRHQGDEDDCYWTFPIRSRVPLTGRLKDHHELDDPTMVSDSTQPESS